MPPVTSARLGRYGGGADALSAALQRGYLPGDPAGGRPAAVGTNAVVEEFVSRLAGQPRKNEGPAFAMSYDDDGAGPLRAALADSRAEAAALRRRVAALETALATAQRAAAPAQQVAALRALVSGLRAQHEALRESVILMKAACGPALASAAACAGVLASRSRAATPAPTPDARARAW
jgi:hypothetical protein